MGYSTEHYDYSLFITDKYGKEYFADVISFNDESAKICGIQKLGYKESEVESVEILEKRQRNRL
jgi:hypothetical protein